MVSTGKAGPAKGVRADGARVEDCLARASAAFAAGKWAAAIQTLEAARRLSAPGTRQEALCLGNLLTAQYRYGAYRSALATAAQLLEGSCAEFYPHAYLTRGNTWWALGEPEAAAADFARAAAAAAAGSPLAVRVRLSWAKLAAEQGRAGDARALLAQVPPVDEPGLQFACTATAAEVAAAAGDWAAVQNLVRQAGEQAGRLSVQADMDLDRAMLRYLEARCCAAAGQTGAARASAFLAAGEFQRLGQSLLWERAIRLARTGQP